jgi:type VI secretion system protein ImpC
LNDLGFIALCHCKGTDYAAFFGGQTINRPRAYDTDQANANARLSSVLPYILASSRFAHYLKSMMRDKIGSFQTKDQISTFLNRWISAYVTADDAAQQAVKAKYPLREARVDVSEVPGKPGAFRATVFLRPHFQLEELTASIRLVAELPPPAA